MFLERNLRLGPGEFWNIVIRYSLVIEGLGCFGKLPTLFWVVPEPAEKACIIDPDFFPL
ncbi:hypothetical protein LEP1GSC061_0865 [Leptospira wolffii serovar Khorat str. Khorat-H2]|nr:hypothetical protein LEP1GSC061_0865 [Leptospira wolffii serovar Khorat str. Khorat-H2]